MELEKTYGKSADTALPLFHYEPSTFGLKDLTAKSLQDFKNLLEADYDLTTKYLYSKIGLNPDDEAASAVALGIY